MGGQGSILHQNTGQQLTHLRLWRCSPDDIDHNSNGSQNGGEKTKGSSPEGGKGSEGTDWKVDTESKQTRQVVILGWDMFIAAESVTWYALGICNWQGNVGCCERLRLTVQIPTHMTCKSMEVTATVYTYSTGSAHSIALTHVAPSAPLWYTNPTTCTSSGEEEAIKPASRVHHNLPRLPQHSYKPCTALLSGWNVILHTIWINSPRVVVCKLLGWMVLSFTMAKAINLGYLVTQPIQKWGSHSSEVRNKL